MSLKDQVLHVLEHSEQVQQRFVCGLSEAERSARGTYERWSAKDQLAHMAFWMDHRARRLSARARGEEPPPSLPHYEQANAECFQRYCDSPWPKVEEMAQSAFAELAGFVRATSEEVLLAPGDDTDGRPLWANIIGVGYTHPLMHLAGFYTEREQREKAGELWRNWGEWVAPLDKSNDWQGLVHYNMACSLALSGLNQQAVAELRQALQLRPGFTSWSRQDTDLKSLHDLPEYRDLYAPAYWWKAIDAGAEAEALADQFMRAFSMLRGAIEAFPAEQWRHGDTLYQRPAGLALHALESTLGYCARKPGQAPAGPDTSWEDKDSSKLPSQEQMLSYLQQTEQAVAGFLADADLSATEDLFPWTGSSLLSRAAYMLRHTQHHLAEMCLELHRRGIKAPDWQ